MKGCCLRVWGFDSTDRLQRAVVLSVWGLRCWKITLAMALFVALRTEAAERVPDFEQDVAPILINRCLECHHAGKSSGGLNLAIETGIRHGGSSGAVIDVDKPTESLLIERVASGEMPPPEDRRHPPLTPDEVATLRIWVVLGSAWPPRRELGLHEQTVKLDEARNFWSFQPVKRPAVPQVSSEPTVFHPIDAFLQQRLATTNMQPGIEATPRQLLRRASLDLAGLPPTLAEQDHFLSDVAPQAYEQLIERLLANPSYGERWARHWLDLVRYADSNGYERDGPKPSVWRYRDYVIDALNRDKPYDQFVLEQLAGDELPDRTAETVIATGFHALGAWQDEVDPLEAPQYRADELDDMLRTTSQTFLGVTIGCARCHNHKFDPISMVDYYSLSAILSPMKRPNVGREDRDHAAGSLADLARIQQRDQQISALSRARDELFKQTENDWLATSQSKLPVSVVEAFRIATKERSPHQLELVQQHMAAWHAEISAALPETRRQQVMEFEQSIQKLRKEIPDLPRAYFSFEETPSPPPSFLLLSGRASNPGPQMQPAVPVALTQSQPTFTPVSQQTSGRRLAFAAWVIRPENPLTARVIVNRVWQHHFGEGLVSTPSDFGRIGARPTHPELLDYLADWFVHDAQWSLKKLHRFIVTSQAYRRTMMATTEQQFIDPENKLLARFPQRRLDVEAIRDSILAISGKLNPEMYGPAVFLPIPATVIEAHTDKHAAWQASTEPDIDRRTIYAYVKRTLLVPMLEVLDLCDTINSTDKRSITSIAPQALTLFNGDFVNQQAAFFAARLWQEVGDNPERQIDRAYRLALCRPPTAHETAVLKQFIELEAIVGADESTSESRQRALTQVCRVIFNLNEFVYGE